MYNFEVRDEELVFKYVSDRDDHWVGHELKEKKRVTIAKVFHFAVSDLVGEIPQVPHFDDTPSWLLAENEPVSPYYVFRVGRVEEDYYRINKSVLGIGSDVLVSRTLPLERRLFVAYRDISVFRHIDAVVKRPIIVGGPNHEAIPEGAFEELLHRFPTSTELTHYAKSRVFNILKEYFGTITDAQRRYQNYLVKRAGTGRRPRLTSDLYAMEAEKFAFIRDRIVEMLKDEKGYSEKDWQRLMIDFLLVIFPKYVAVLENVRVKDFYSDPSKPKNRFIDIALVDASGNLDVVEIKKPFEDGLLSSGRYRDNYTPSTALSGTIMQAEKYLMHLSKWGAAGERTLSERHALELPAGLSIKVTSPKGLIISGRSNAFTELQRFDFDILRRKYANIVDIITYDDLLARLANLISLFQGRAATGR